ncbi:MAG: amidohydrolase [Actinobacteria bacterium]|uniref:Unannotated protein n=1 Tax=freshwater metagenome TaxID=449393 RepID=A0A6J6EM23_9ZZZZ|nr:amidohydrolase [Actinomycetota bacterium]MTA33161.1 amidohydrolase [Actinomycetota bacterium]
MTNCSYHELVELRRAIHKDPELRFSEHRTSERIKAFLVDHGWEVHKDPESPGLVARWPGAQKKIQVLVRADIDAYPVQDGKKVPYASANAGVAHACGHDVHTTAALGLACRLASEPDVRDHVSILFQPAEEIPFGESSGARRMLDSGLLGDSYDAIVGLHCWPQLEVGTIGIDSGPAMAAKDGFGIEFHGMSTHAATPALARDALLAAADAILSLHAAVSRFRNPNELVAFNVGTIAGGRSQSAVPDLVFITGTLRSHDEGVRQRLKVVIERVAHASANKFDVTADFTWANQMPAVVNSPGLVSLALEVLPETKHTIVELTEPPLTTDDFSLLAERGPTLYFKLGVTPVGADAILPLHTGLFDVDEGCIPVAVDGLERLVKSALASVERGENLS